MTDEYAKWELVGIVLGCLVGGAVTLALIASFLATAIVIALGPFYFLWLCVEALCK